MSARAVDAHAHHCASARRASVRGFSLLEVLVAFVILALVATALFRLFSARSTTRRPPRSGAARCCVAESRSTSAAAAQPLREGTERGTDDDGRMRWHDAVAAVRARRTSTPSSSARRERIADAALPRSVDVKFPGATAARERVARAVDGCKLAATERCSDDRRARAASR